MKRKMFILSLCIITSTFIGACSKNTKSEYDIEEFGKIYNEAEAAYNEQTKYMTDEEKLGEEGYKIYKKCAIEAGLPVEKEITIRGLKDSFYNGFYIVSENHEYEFPCLIGISKNEFVFIDNGDPIEVKGIFCKDENNPLSLSDITLVSPEITPTYKENIAQTLSTFEIDGSEECVVMGKVSSVISVSDFNKYYLDTSTNTIRAGLSRDVDDKVAILTPEDSTNQELPTNIYVAYSDPSYDALAEGDKVAVEGTMYDFQHFYFADGTATVISGMFDYPYNIYKFD